MKMIKYLLIVFAALTGIVLILGLVAPKDFKVERSVVVNAQPQEVLPYVKSLKKMHEWSPWTELDPHMKINDEGREGEVGSKQYWEGNDKVGKGMQEILSVSDTRVETKVKFIEPWESELLSLFSLSPENNGTRVTWTTSGRNPFPFNVMCLFMDMDSMMGKDFEKGLGKLKVMVEKK